MKTAAGGGGGCLPAFFLVMMMVKKKTQTLECFMSLIRLGRQKAKYDYMLQKKLKNGFLMVMESIILVLKIRRGICNFSSWYIYIYMICLIISG